MIHRNRLKVWMLAMALGLSADVLASTADWQPAPVEQLVQLPVDIISKRVEKDFRASPMAGQLASLDGQMETHIAAIQALQKQLQSADESAQTDLQFQLVEKKSAYLDALQEANRIRQQAVKQKQALYQALLQKMRGGKRHAAVVRQEIGQMQEAAYARMQKVMQKLDSNLMSSSWAKPDAYADAYQENLAKIDALKNAIANHKANRRPSRNGVVLSGEAYIREILLDFTSQQSLLDQEQLMMSYMARLVALDAQALEYKMTYADVEAETANPLNKPASPAKVSELFY